MPDNSTTTSTPVNPPADDAAVSSVAPVNPTTGAPAVPSSSVSSEPTSSEPTMRDSFEGQDIKTRVAHAIADSQNVLVALSSDPSVDEMAAAIGLSLYLDRLGKRATAIYSGTTPNALEFLKPEDTFEPSTDALQDFVVALNKEKADHVRCKVDGDYVKMYITPYRTRVGEEDLEFSYGDYNVDLVLALDVANGIDLDSALREHGRIMHDASIINVTTGNPGKFGEIEWSDKTASSISEMFSDLILNTNAKEKLSPEEATAFLTGIVAATDRFSTAATTSETMKIASKLMEAGANQQLISQNITDDIENEMFNVSSAIKTESKKEEDSANIDIEHTDDEELPERKEDEKKPKEEPSEGMSQESSLLADLQQAAASLAQAGDETVPVPDSEPIKIDSAESSNDLFKTTGEEETPAVTLGKEAFEKKESDQRDYNKMMEEALGNAEPMSAPAEDSTAEQSTAPESYNPAAMNAPQVASAPEINGVPEINYAPSANSAILPPPPAPPIDENVFTPTEDIMNASAPMPDLSSVSEDSVPKEVGSNDVAPALDMPSSTETNSSVDLPSQVPEDTGLNSPEKTEPEAESEASTPTSLGSQPAMQDQVYNPQANDPSAFKIPGM